MVTTINGFTEKEVVNLYRFLCIYESELGKIGNQEAFEKKFSKLKDLEKLMSSLTCNYCSRESLNIVGIVPMNNLVSMTKCRTSKILSLLHHLRNSIAHAQIEQEKGYVSLIDYGYEKDKKSKTEKKVFSARGKIKTKTLFEMILIIMDNIKSI